jgi:hypothetical protein
MSAARDGRRDCQIKRAANHRTDRWGSTMHKFKERRSPPGATEGALPGFYRVRIGSLVEIGDQTLDESGRPCPIALDQVGREVTPDRLVLRIERRQDHD